MLRDRVITALILAPFLLWILIWAPHAVTVPVIAVAILVGAWEWARFCGWTLFGKRFAYVIAIGAAMALASRLGATPSGLSAIWAIALLWWVVAFCWLALAPLRVNGLLAAVAGVLVLVPTWIALVELDRVPERAPSYLLFVLVLVFAADIGAYFAGRAFGRLKLAPRVSPGKTWEGVFGGLVSAALVAVGGAFWFALPLSRFLPLCTAVAVVSIVGDLTESMFKRHVGLKDSSGLLPGHGGILDRIDSLTAATPVFALGLMWLGVL
jgi:phosphatidate cytidylyltransferase